MIELNSVFTTVGVILIAISSSLNWIYLSKSDAQLYNSIIPFGLNFVVLIYIGYGFVVLNSISLLVKLIILTFLAALCFVDINAMYKKPGTQAEIVISEIVLIFGTLVRLYFMISLNSDAAKSLFVIATKRVVESTVGKSAPESRPLPVSDQKPVPGFDRISQLFSDVLKKENKLTPEEIQEQKNKLRILYGKDPVAVALTGGSRRKR